MSRPRCPECRRAATEAFVDSVVQYKLTWTDREEITHLPMFLGDSGTEFRCPNNHKWTTR